MSNNAVFIDINPSDNRGSRHAFAEYPLAESPVGASAHHLTRVSA